MSTLEPTEEAPDIMEDDIPFSDQLQALLVELSKEHREALDTMPQALELTAVRLEKVIVRHNGRLKDLLDRTLKREEAANQMFDSIMQLGSRMNEEANIWASGQEDQERAREMKWHHDWSQERWNSLPIEAPEPVYVDKGCPSGDCGSAHCKKCGDGPLY